MVIFTLVTLILGTNKVAVAPLIDPTLHFVLFKFTALQLYCVVGTPNLKVNAENCVNSGAVVCMVTKDVLLASTVVVHFAELN